MKIVLNEGAVMPSRAHSFDGGLDLYSRNDRTIQGFDSEGFDTGVHVQIPEGCVGFIKSRSGMLKNGILTDGTIDCGYTGSIRVRLFNFSHLDYQVHEGDRIAQLVIVPCVLLPLEEADSLGRTDRGDHGFGSTGR